MRLANVGDDAHKANVKALSGVKEILRWRLVNTLMMVVIIVSCEETSRLYCPDTDSTDALTERCGTSYHMTSKTPRCFEEPKFTNHISSTVCHLISCSSWYQVTETFG